MRTRMVAIGLAVSLALAGCQSASKPDSSAQTQHIAWREGDVADALAEAKESNKPALLYWGAKWCPPCNQELPIAQKEVWEKHKDNPKFAFLVFGREEDWEKLIPFKEKKGFTFPILPDKDRSIFDLFAPNGIPRNVVIDPEGKIIYQSIGFSPEEFEKLVAFIDSKL